MNRATVFAVVVLCLFSTVATVATAADGSWTSRSLTGGWAVQYLDAGGKPAENVDSLKTGQLLQSDWSVKPDTFEIRGLGDKPVELVLLDRGWLWIGGDCLFGDKPAKYRFNNGNLELLVAEHTWQLPHYFPQQTREGDGLKLIILSRPTAEQLQTSRTAASKN